MTCNIHICTVVFCLFSNGKLLRRLKLQNSSYFFFPENCYRKIIQSLKYIQFIFLPSIHKDLMAFLNLRVSEEILSCKREILFQLIKIIKSKLLKLEA